MDQVIRSGDRFVKRLGWLTARWHFSFADYHDPANVRFGALRVFNDDLIAPGGGFPMHGHGDMEIVSYVLQGALEHRDSLGNQGVIEPGQAQVMTAGSGLEHSEFNPGDETTRLLQIWIEPRQRGLAPRWEQLGFTRADRLGRWLPLASGRGHAGAAAIDQDAVLQVAALPAGQHLSYEPAGGRLYLFCAEGAARLGGLTLGAGDQLRRTAAGPLELTAEVDSELVLIDLA